MSDSFHKYHPLMLGLGGEAGRSTQFSRLPAPLVTLLTASQYLGETENVASIAEAPESYRAPSLTIASALLKQERKTALP